MWQGEEGEDGRAGSNAEVDGGGEGWGGCREWSCPNDVCGSCLPPLAGVLGDVSKAGTWRAGADAAEGMERSSTNLRAGRWSANLGRIQRSRTSGLLNHRS